MTTRPEYPRPDFDRSHCWLSLNGSWDFQPDSEQQGISAHWEQPGNTSWQQQILVPFAWETQQSGIAQEWLPMGWYRTHLQIPATWQDKQTILHFGAVHYHSQVWINQQLIGEHTGGYLPFEFDITEALQAGQNELVVCVEAPLDKLALPHGKQKSLPADDYNDCAFTASSGIWQSVWLEGRPTTFIHSVRLRPTAGLDGFEAQIDLQGKLENAQLSIQAEGVDGCIIAVQGTSPLSLELHIEKPQLWTPATPHLYEFVLQLQSQDGVDQVKCTGGLRSIEIQGQRFLLNGEQVYLRGALDQGYWPNSGYTAPTDEALRLDVELALQAGYNLIRKHIKLEDPRWLYWADRLGLLVWAEPPCTGRYSQEAVARFEAQLPGMVARDGNHPSIILWGIYNEEWGLDWSSALDKEKQVAVIRAYDLLAAHDRSRPIIDDSGWNHVKTDVLDWHYYDENNQNWQDVTTRLAEEPNPWFGHQLSSTRWYETQLSVDGYPYKDMPIMNGEYGSGRNALERGWYLRWQTQELRRHLAISGYIYTELCDVEYEHCGIYDAQRHLKPFGFDPTTVNSETMLVFDLIPQEPGIDYAVTEQEGSLELSLAHQGHQTLQGKLVWWWEGENIQSTSQCLECLPYTVTPLPTLHFTLPTSQNQGRLHVQFWNENEQCHARSFVDIARIHREGFSALNIPNSTEVD